MKHLCNCGKVVEAVGKNLLIATCPNCGMYYLYASEVNTPLNEENLLKNIQSKVHSHKEVLEELLLDDDVAPYVYHSEENDVVEEVNDIVKVKPRAAKRR